MTKDIKIKILEIKLAIERVQRILDQIKALGEQARLIVKLLSD